MQTIKYSRDRVKSTSEAAADYLPSIPVAASLCGHVGGQIVEYKNSWHWHHIVWMVLIAFFCTG